jgi:hypothetical protein
MRKTLLFVASIASLVIIPPAPSSAATAIPKAAVFDFEFIDSSLEGEKNGVRPDEQDRLAKIGNQLRKGLADSGKFQIVDIAPVEAEAHHSNLQACGGCDVRLAEQLGADLAITGTVQKVSNLILNVNVYVRDAHSDKSLAAMSVDMRGNTDESWSRAMSYLLRNRLLEPNYGRLH